jgi:hypothetical protein
MIVEDCGLGQPVSPTEADVSHDTDLGPHQLGQPSDRVPRPGRRIVANVTACVNESISSAQVCEAHSLGLAHGETP